MRLFEIGGFYTSYIVRAPDAVAAVGLVKEIHSQAYFVKEIFIKGPLEIIESFEE